MREERTAGVDAVCRLDALPVQERAGLKRLGK